MKRKAKLPKPVMAWGGFCDDKLHHSYVKSEWNGPTYLSPAVYARKLDASADYEDIREVRIVQVAKKRRTKP